MIDNNNHKMKTANIWQQSANLTNRVFQVTSGLNLPYENYWTTFVIISLSQANERLNSIRTLLEKGYQDSATILTRSLFELAANLSYIAKDTNNRLSEYLKHGGIPLTTEDAQKLQKQIAQEQTPEVKDIVQGKPWKRLKAMCCDLGSQWTKEYETFYRYASVPTHAGSFTLGQNYLQLSTRQPPSENDLAIILVTALVFHLRIATIAANVFPEQIKLETIKEMVSECRKLEQSLAKT